MRTRTHAVAVAMAATVATPGLAALAEDHGPLVTPAELAAALDDDAPVVLDIRTPDAYAEGHVDGALNAPYSFFRGPEDNPGQLVPEDELTQTLQQLGLDADSQVVVTYQGSSVTDFGAAARVYWTLKSAGISDLAILNGGLDAWTAADETLTKSESSALRSDFTVTWDDTWTATSQDVQAAIDGDSDTLLLDARPESFWNGTDAHPAAARPGTLPQSEYFTHSNWFNSGPAIADADAVRALAEERGLTDAEGLISFCNTGHWAATNWFALSELAGIDDVKLYPESMVGWSNAGFEMANVPGRLEMLWRQVRGIF